MIKILDRWFNIDQIGVIIPARDDCIIITLDYGTYDVKGQSADELAKYINKQLGSIYQTPSYLP